MAVQLCVRTAPAVKLLRSFWAFREAHTGQTQQLGPAQPPCKAVVQVLVDGETFPGDCAALAAELVRFRSVGLRLNSRGPAGGVRMEQALAALLAAPGLPAVLRGLAMSTLTDEGEDAEESAGWALPAGALRLLLPHHHPQLTILNFEDLRVDGGMPSLAPLCGLRAPRLRHIVLPAWPGEPDAAVAAAATALGAGLPEPGCAPPPLPLHQPHGPAAQAPGQQGGGDVGGLLVLRASSMMPEGAAAVETVLQALGRGWVKVDVDAQQAAVASDPDWWDT